MRDSSPDIIDFSQDYYHGKAPKGLQEHLIKHWNLIFDSPHLLLQKVKDQIQSAFAYKNIEVHCLNSLAEGYHQVLNLFRNSRVTIDLPCSPELLRMARHYAAHIRLIENPLANDAFQNTKLAILSNPQLVNGQYLYPDELEDIFINHRETYFLLDERFEPFTEQPSSMIQQLEKHPNVLIIKSFSEILGFEGISQVYLFGTSRVINTVESLYPEQRPSTLNLLTTEFFIPELPQCRIHSHIIMERLDLQQKLNLIDGVEVYKTYTSYFLIRTTLKAQKLAKLLEEEFKIKINPLEEYGGLDTFFSRIQSLPFSHSPRLIEGIEKILSFSK